MRLIFFAPSGEIPTSVTDHHHPHKTLTSFLDWIPASQSLILTDVPLEKCHPCTHHYHCPPCSTTLVNIAKGKIQWVHSKTQHFEIPQPKKAVRSLHPKSFNRNPIWKPPLLPRPKPKEKKTHSHLPIFLPCPFKANQQCLEPISINPLTIPSSYVLELGGPRG